MRTLVEMLGVVALAVFGIYLMASSPLHADNGLGASASAAESKIMFCYDHFDPVGLTALGNLLNAEKGLPLSIDDGPAFAKHMLVDVCLLDTLSDHCLTPQGRMQACISAIVLG